MYVSKKINRQTLKLLSISLLVTALITSPSLDNKTLQLFTGSPNLEYNVQAQTLNKSDIPSKTQFEVAQAPSPSEEESSPAEQEEIIDFFAMAMGALAGLELFI